MRILTIHASAILFIFGALGVSACSSGDPGENNVATEPAESDDVGISVNADSCNGPRYTHCGHCHGHSMRCCQYEGGHVVGNCWSVDCN
jgi:hypothetical protein